MTLSLLDFENTAKEAREYLFNAYVNEKTFRAENSYRPLPNGESYYEWELTQINKIHNDKYFAYKKYLEQFAIGDFEYCESIIKKRLS